KRARYARKRHYPLPQGGRKGTPLLYSLVAWQATSYIVGACPCGRPRLPATHAFCLHSQLSPSILELTNTFLLRRKLLAFFLNNLWLCLRYKGLIRQFTLETGNLLLRLGNLFVEPP